MNFDLRLREFKWNGPTLEQKMARAMGRAIVRIGEEVVVEAKQRAHVETGTLRRSIHSAPVGYMGADQARAEVVELDNATIGDVSYDGPLRAQIEAGSWVEYACVEETGRGHQFITPAVELVRLRCDSIIRQAMWMEGLY